MISVTKEVDVDVYIAAGDLDDAALRELVNEATTRGMLPYGAKVGDGDAAHAETIIERAFLAARRLPTIPRELADMFWEIHGRALA